jgi:DNA repair exonuclease SbcCD nuclease subunit
MAEVNSLHRSAAWIPKDVLRRGWEYIALGDWHQHRHRPLSDAHAYYPGSLEALTFGEAVHYPARQHDPYAVHGALDVRLRALGAEPRILTLANPAARPVLRLRSIDAEELDVEGLMTQLRERLEADLPKEVLVLLEIANCDHNVWNQLDQEELAKLRDRIRQCHIRPDWVHHEVGDSDEAFQLTTVAEQWSAFVAERESDDRLREVLHTKGLERIEAARQAVRGQLADVGLA